MLLQQQLQADIDPIDWHDSDVTDLFLPEELLFTDDEDMANDYITANPNYQKHNSPSTYPLTPEEFLLNSDDEKIYQKHHSPSTYLLTPEEFLFNSDDETDTSQIQLEDKDCSVTTQSLMDITFTTEYEVLNDNILQTFLRDPEKHTACKATQTE